MIVDFLSMFSAEQALTGTTADSTKTLDIKKAGISNGGGYIYVRNVGAVTGLQTVTLSGDDGAGFKDILTATVTDLTDGGGINIKVPQGCPQKLKLVYKGTGMTGKVNAGVTLQVDSPRGKRIGDFEANPNFA